MKNKFQQMADGESCVPIPDGYLMQCCDCGLVHELKLRAVRITKRMPNGEFRYEELDTKKYRVELTAWRKEQSQQGSNT